MEAVDVHADEWKRSKRRLNDCFTFAANASCADGQLSCSSEVRKRLYPLALCVLMVREQQASTDH